MRFLNFPGSLVYSVVLLAFMSIGCRAKVKKLKSPPNYDFSVAVRYKLDPKLKEISGLVYDPKNNVFYAINDEKGTLFVLDKDIMTPPSEHSFGENGDWEEVVLMHDVPYVLRSDGLIMKILKDSSGKFIGREAGAIELNGTNDFEAMYHDPGRNALVVICKNCADDNSGSVSAYGFYPDSIGFYKKPLFVIDADKVSKMSPHKTAKFQPSAAAIHPITQKVFILSAASNQLVITDQSGNVEAVYQLSKKLFPQPEGITFNQKGSMFISNEGVASPGLIIKFVYNESGVITKEDEFKTGYNFSQPDEKMELAEALHEISGMAYIPGKDIILAHGDEKGNIYTVDFKKKDNNFGKVKFSGKGDYEDIVYTDSADYLLMSTGGVVKVLTEDSMIVPKEFTLPIEGKNEFETLYKDADGSLILLCKECDHEKDLVRTAYKFDPKSETFSTDPVYKINISEIQAMLRNDAAEFKPSAAGIHPVTGQLFVIASVGKLLAIFNKEGKLETVLRLDPLLYNQPEGLTFAPNGDLYISNEGGEGVARIFKFNYKQQPEKPAK